ncbi:UvrD-like helicase ATP-binding domain-containing protein [Stackebrandtia soli]
MTVAMYGRRLSEVDSVEYGLCFGRLDFDDGVTRYVGRTGLLDPDRSKPPLLVDWRADAARPFYQATAAAPEGVRRRRHIHTSGRTVTDVNDEVLDLSAPRSEWREEVTGEAALLAALTADRTGRMRDIVETIQSEQDAIIRSGLDGVLVVQGGPGTGKTAVALHRAAYLLYEHRDRLAKRGVLLIGPSPTFLRYIGDVLPGLAETDVLLRTIGDLYPGESADRPEVEGAAAIKGDLSMVEVMRRAVADRQRVPDSSVDMDTEYGPLLLTPEEIAEARAAARSTDRPHNRARAVFVTAVLAALAAQVAHRIGEDPLGGENLLGEADVDEVAAELAVEPDVQAVLDWLWPVLTPQQLVAGLFGTDARIASAAPDLTAAQRRDLLRPARSGWSVSEIPLLDEAAELLGEVDGSAANDREERRRAERAAYAQGVLDIAAGSASIDVEDEDDPEILLVTDIMDAAILGERHVDASGATTAERAAADRLWTFGHIVVDEAQELSPMAWRMVMRRSVTRSLTVVGDLAQTGAAHGASSWDEVLGEYVADRYRFRELTVSYRTPASIMSVAAEVLSRIDPRLSVPRAVRDVEDEPWRVLVSESALVRELASSIDRERELIGDGRLGVIVPRGRQLALAGALGLDVAGDLTEPVVISSVDRVKGLEFDAVVVVDGPGIVAESRHGLNDLYVAVTRATRRLGRIDVTG